jgi:hypothetical protein
MIMMICDDELIDCHRSYFRYYRHRPSPCVGRINYSPAKFSPLVSYSRQNGGPLVSSSRQNFASAAAGGRRLSFRSSAPLLRKRFHRAKLTKITRKVKIWIHLHQLYIGIQYSVWEGGFSCNHFQSGLSFAKIPLQNSNVWFYDGGAPFPLFLSWAPHRSFLGDGWQATRHTNPGSSDPNSDRACMQCTSSTREHHKRAQASASGTQNCSALALFGLCATPTNKFENLTSSCFFISFRVAGCRANPLESKSIEPFPSSSYHHHWRHRPTRHSEN